MMSRSTAYRVATYLNSEFPGWSEIFLKEGSWVVTHEGGDHVFHVTNGMKQARTVVAAAHQVDTDYWRDLAEALAERGREELAAERGQ